MYKEGRSKADYEEGEERAQEKLTTSGGARVKAGESMLLAGREDPWKQDCDSCEDERDQG